MSGFSGLILLVPGLLQPPRGAESVFDECPDLTRWLMQSRREPGFTDLETALAAVFQPSDTALSLAALRYAAESDPAQPDWVAFADPVHLRIDPSRAILYGPELLQLSPAESQALATAVNEHLSAEGLRLHIGTDGQWFLHGQAPAPLQARALGEVVGRNAEPFLPGGPGAPYWRRLLNEIQMLLHAHPVNEQRSDRGLPTVSGIWPWSPGRVPSRVDSDLGSVASDDRGIATLAALAGVKNLSPPQADTVPGAQLLADFGLQRAADSGDVERWQAAFRAVGGSWRDHLRSGRRRGGLCLWPLDGQLYQAGAWRPWRRRRWPGFAAWRESYS